MSKVIDGDTFWIDDGSDKGTKVRLIGVDAPETRRTRNKEIGYYAQESKEYLKNLIEGKKIRLEYDVDTLDLYRRTLAYVYTEKSLFVNAELVKRGYAMVMTVPPNVEYADKFVKLTRKARKKERGLWREMNEK
ncbi:MAG: thermonuclease family protein [Bacteroidales bacterium]